MTTNTNDSVKQDLSFDKDDVLNLSSGIDVNRDFIELSDEEIDRQISESINYANKLTGIWEQYKPSSNYYRSISDELGGKKVTANGLKYPYEITERDLFFPLSDEPSQNNFTGESANNTTD